MAQSALEVRVGPIIEAGQSLSNGLDCRGGVLVRITMPLIWTPANLSFQISTDGIDYNDLFTSERGEVLIPVVPGAALVLNQFGDFFHSFDYIKVRSGSRLWPVIQAARRQFAVAINLEGGPKIATKPSGG